MPLINTIRNDSPVPYPALKQVTDKVLSVIMMLLCSPLFLAIAVLIKLSGIFYSEDSGPVFRYEYRISKGKKFKFYKFRFIRQKILAGEGHIRLRDRAKTLEKDIYCTTAGRYLKKIYLDELPQFYNIWRGEMSWVGPRPFPVDDYENDLRKGDVRKKVIIAGLTGLVQINKGRKIARSDAELDNEYIRKSRELNSYKLWLYDMQIMLRTLWVIFQGKGL